MYLAQATLPLLAALPASRRARRLSGKSKFSHARSQCLLLRAGMEVGFTTPRAENSYFISCASPGPQHVLSRGLVRWFFYSKHGGSCSTTERDESHPYQIFHNSCKLLTAEEWLEKSSSIHQPLLESTYLMSVPDSNTSVGSRPGTREAQEARDVALWALKIKHSLRSRAEGGADSTEQSVLITSTTELAFKVSASAAQAAMEFTSVFLHKWFTLHCY